jgi:cytidylate kinase
MSTQTDGLNYQKAYETLVDNIYAPVFFEKLATDYGINPTTEDEAREFLVLAGKLQQLDEANQVKQASERTSFVSKASQQLDSMLYGAGVQTPTQVRESQEIKQAASQLAKNPVIRDAALLYQDCVRQLQAQA